MKNTVEKYLNMVRLRRADKKRLIRSATILSLFVVIGVCWQLKLTGVTMTDEPTCGLEEHTHTDCQVIDRKLICGFPEEEETEFVCGLKEHTHEDACYEITEEEVLACELMEHEHTDACYEEATERVLICELEETEAEPVLVCSEEHEHTEECYELVSPEAAHVHGDECYREETVRKLVCTEEAHTHDEACYSIKEVKTLVCTETEHTHDETCTAAAESGHVHTDECWEPVYDCGLEEHKHSVACYADLTVDVETAADWEATLPELSGDPKADLVAVARSQIGYTESENNYIMSEEKEDEQCHSSRYGLWYGNQYGEWNSMFTSFCLSYAGFDEHKIPYGAGADSWFSSLNDMGLIKTSTWQLTDGCVVFLDTDGDGRADRTAVTESVRVPELYVIEGDVDGMVCQNTYTLDQLMGFVTVQRERMLLGASGTGNNVVPRMVEYDYEYSMTEGFPESALNAWQIVTQHFDNVVLLNTSGDNSGAGQYVYSSDNAVRIQKAVIPTGVENEFQIYLNVEPQLSWTEFIKAINVFQSHNNSSTFNPSSGCSMVLSLDQYNMLPASDRALFSPFTVTFTDTNRNKTYTVTMYGNFTGSGKEAIQNVPNGSVAFGNEKFGTYGLQNNINWRNLLNDPSQGLNIDITSLASHYEFAEDIVYPDYVTDPMGEHIVYDGMVSYDGGSYVAPSDQNEQTLTWVLPTVDYPDPPFYSSHTEEVVEKGGIVHQITIVDGCVEKVLPNGKSAYYYINCLEMRYKIKLDVTDEGFVSCAPVNASPSTSILPTNGDTLLYYNLGETPTSNPAQFTVPTIKGLLYDIGFLKVGDDGRNLSGAVFALYEEDGETPVLDKNGDPYVLTTVAGEMTKFIDLPWGNYVLKETKAPPHYGVPDDPDYNITLCYTTAPTKLKPDSGAQSGNMIYKEMDDSTGTWKIVDPLKPLQYKLNIVKTDETGAKHLMNVGFSVTDPSDPTKVLTGTTDDEGNLVFDTPPFGVNVVYTLTETDAPQGYFGLPNPVRFRVTEDANMVATAEIMNPEELYGMVTIELNEDQEGCYVTLTVQNRGGFSLPNSGGPGAELLVLTGLLLMSIPVIYRYTWRHRRERRSNG